MGIITYEDRVGKMKVPGDEDKQLHLAKKYVKTLKSRARRSCLLDEKINRWRDVEAAESVLRRLRRNIFDLGDLLSRRSK